MNVLISIKPEWCELIASGKKTIAVRKTKPRSETPFRCYIYQTKHRKNNGSTYSDGRVIGEFVCDEITGHDLPYPAYQSELDKDLLAAACVDYWMLHRYVWSGGRFYCWHISGLKIYEKPKELKDFQITTTHPQRRIKQPPQSWIYAEEIK